MSSPLLTYNRVDQGYPTLADNVGILDFLGASRPCSSRCHLPMPFKSRFSYAPNRFRRGS
jgi:hypothetical protein